MHEIVFFAPYVQKFVVYLKLSYVGSSLIELCEHLSIGLREVNHAAEILVLFFGLVLIILAAVL